MNDLGKVLVIAGLVLTAIGLVLGTGFGRQWLGRLPGDIHWNSNQVSFHFPIVTCLLISAIMTFLMWFFRR